MLPLEGKVAVITGGTSGIGARTAEVFVASGAKVVISGRRRERGEKLAGRLGDVDVVQASVKEKRIQDGKDISGEFVFMDLLKKRAGKWVIVRTLGARVS